MKTWIYSKLEYLLGAASGLSTMVIDVPQILLKLLLAVILGFLGAFGGHLYKIIAAKLKRK